MWTPHQSIPHWWCPAANHVSPPPSAGAFALDPVAGSVPVTLLTPLPSNFTAAVTSAPYSLVYIATSAVGGFMANATRSLVVVDPCLSSSGGTEFTCPNTLKCSINAK